MMNSVADTLRLAIADTSQPSLASLSSPDRCAGAVEVIVAALPLLDVRLSAAADAIKVLFGPESTRDIFRGLHIKPADVDRTLGRTPVAPLLGPLGGGTPLLSPDHLRGTRFDRLRALYDLSPFDIDVLLVALAPEIDARYERIYAFIQDDVTRKRPTVDLALNLLCGSVAEKLARLERFSPDAPLIGQGLVRLLPADGQPDGLRLGAALRLDEAVLGYLLGHDSMDARVTACCRVLEPERASRAARRAQTRAGAALVVYVQARDLEEAAVAVRRHAGERQILVLEVERALWSGGDSEAVLAAVFRSALIRDYVMLVHDADLLLDGEHSAKLGQLLRRAASHREDVYLDGRSRWEPANRSTASVIELEPGALPHAQAAAVWTKAVERQGAEAVPALMARLAATFPTLGTAQIAAAALDSVRQGAGMPGVAPTAEAMLEGARAQTRGALRGLAERVPIRPEWDELILPPQTLAQLREVAMRVTRRATVMDDWGFAGRRYGRGTTVLFSGSSGTGKTFAAAVLAAEIGQDLYRIDLASVISKYIGETEKKLAQVFDGADRANCVLLFDEADALFGKRSEVRDAHDRYANQEVAYLLQRVERFEGLAILTSNLSGSIDQAFARRLGGSVFFELPDLAARHQLWQRALPSSAPRDSDLDLALLAREVRISGGVISKAALAAAFLAADEGAPIGMRHLLRALRREVSSLGIAVPALLTAKTA
jgi:ATPase family associated with various cellular activities (AAA)